MPTAISARKPRGQGAVRRDEILAAAKRLFVEKGYEQATMRRIAAEVGVSAAALYGYFPDKDAMLWAIAEAAFGELLARLEESQRGDAPPLDRFRAGLRAYIAFGLARPEEYRLVFLGRPPAPELPAGDDHRGGGRSAGRSGGIDDAGRAFAVLERSIAALIGAGRFAPRDPLAAAEASWACLHGATALLLDKREHVRTPPEALVEAVVDLVVRGLAA